MYSLHSRLWFDLPCLCVLLPSIYQLAKPNGGRRTKMPQVGLIKSQATVIYCDIWRVGHQKQAIGHGLVTAQIMLCDVNTDLYLDNYFWYAMFHMLCANSIVKRIVFLMHRGKFQFSFKCRVRKMCVKWWHGCGTHIHMGLLAAT